MSSNEETIHSIAAQFVLPSKTIINYDLNSSYHDPMHYSEQKDSNNNLQHNDLIMMANHHITSSDSSIWAPADKHPQIAPIEYEHWIKTHANTNQPQVNVSRKRSVLSNVSYHSEEDDSDTTDEEDEAVTPTLVVKPELTALPRNANPEINSKEVRRQEVLLQGSSTNSFGSATPFNSIPNQTRGPKDDIYIKERSAPLSNSMDMQQFETRDRSLHAFEATSPIYSSPQTADQPLDYQKTKKSSWFKDLFSRKSKKNGLFSKKQTKDTPTTSFIKKLSHSASSKSLNTSLGSSKSLTTSSASPNSSNSLPPSSLKKKQSESAFKRMPLPSSLKKKQAAPPPPPPPPLPPIVHTRYPINTERAIYRLSHVKLSNARRPLRQQVVISNMMFWYLSVTEKEQDDHFLEYQPTQYDYHQENQTQQEAYYNNGIYQTNLTQQEEAYYNDSIYQSFEPSGPGNGAYHHYGHQYHSEYDSLRSYHTSPAATPPLQQHSSDASAITEKKKKKYKPVRNTQYSPSMVTASQ